MARSRKYGKTWWGNAWVEALERIDQNTNRLPRGRSYANVGRVSEIKIDAAGRVNAKVRGTRPTPYKIEIKLREFTPREKETAGAIIAEDPALAAELSMGRLPETILKLLDKHNISLLPESWSDIIALLLPGLGQPVQTPGGGLLYHRQRNRQGSFNPVQIT